MTNLLKSISKPIKLQEAPPEIVKAVQKELNRIGLNVGAEDGIAGNRTIGQFQQFKINNHLGDLDTLGATTAAKLLGAQPQLLVSESQAESIFGRQITLNQLADLNNCLQRFDIDTPTRIRHFMAQVAHESGGFQWMCEIASGEAYEGRRDLGNINRGDGRKFKGAGAIHLTGRANYRALADFLNDPRVIDEGCIYVATHLPLTASGFWWMNNRLNELCDQGASCRRISARVNGKDPANGLAERERYYAIACKVIL